MKKMLMMMALNRSGECTGSVPDLEFDGLVSECDVAELEVDADGGKGGVVVGLICEAREQAALAHSRVADEDQLEDVVVVRRCVCHCVLGLCCTLAASLLAVLDADLFWSEPDGLMYSPRLRLPWPAAVVAIPAQRRDFRLRRSDQARINPGFAVTLFAEDPNK